MEKKYFMSYVAYEEGEMRHPLFLNEIMYIDEDITSQLIADIQDNLSLRVGEESKKKYYTQIINLVLLSD